MKKILTIILMLTTALTYVGCKKIDNWLDVKSAKSLAIPTTLKQFQALLDRDIMYYSLRGINTVLVSTDNMYYPDDRYQAVTDESLRNLYTWEKKVWPVAFNVVYEWDDSYSRILQANVVLDGISDPKKVTDFNTSEYDNVKGQALFHRAWNFYLLAQMFSKQYDPATANSDLGIPLKLTADVNAPVKRGSIADTYKQIVSDLTTAEALLVNVPLVRSRPAKGVARALLAKVSLAMGNYGEALKYSNQALEIENGLMDFNKVTVSSVQTTQSFPTLLPRDQSTHPEIILYLWQSSNSGLGTNMSIDTTLYKSYDSNDLRKSVFFGTIQTNPLRIYWRGNYNGLNSHFVGFVTGEQYLIKAECLARMGNIQESMNVLNTLMIKRWKTGTFTTPFVATTSQQALQIILRERRKELVVFNMVRWEDLRRLNKDPNFAVTITRNLLGKTYTLPPNDPRYVLPIPDNEIKFSGIEQNVR